MNFTWPTDPNVDIQKHCILMGLGGSRSYGTDHPLSDTDWRGIMATPEDILFSPFRNFEQKLWKGEGKTGRVSEVAGIAEADEEGTVYALDKFFQLAADCNPNVVELLYLRPQDYVHNTKAGQMLIEGRALFLSQRAAKTFCGYAMHQLKRIEGHRRWLTNPPTHVPTREEFGLPPIKSADTTQLQAVEAILRRNTEAFAPWLIHSNNSERAGFWEGVANIVCLITEAQGTIWDPVENHWMNIERAASELVGTQLGFDTDFQVWLKNEKAYANARSDYDKYEAWKRNRNPARAEIEARYGYDCKHAMHLVRLMTMAEELVGTGSMHVYRPDREVLLEIRNGAWEYDFVIDFAQRQQTRVYDLVRNHQTPLPVVPNQTALESLYYQVLETALGW